MKKTKRNFLLGFLAITLAAILFQSCVRKVIDLNDLGPQQYTPNLAAPLVFSSLSIGDIIKGSSVIVGTDNFCTLIYKGTLFSFQAKDIFVLPPQVYAQTINLANADILQLTGQDSVTVNFTQTISYDAGSKSPQIDSLIYKSGILTDSIVSDFKHNLRITVNIPKAKKAGKSFSQTLKVNYTGTSPVTTTDKVDLSGYHFDMSNGGTGNKFDINYSVTVLFQSGNAVSTSNQITIVQKCTNPTFDKLYGYFGQQSLIPGTKDMDTVALSVFKTSVVGTSFTLDDPRIKFLFTNSFGVPIKANLVNNQVIGFTAPSSTYPLTGSGIPSTLPIQSPTIAQVGQIKTDSFTIDKTNSTILSVMNNSPQSLIYQIASLSNPSGNVSENFVIDTSRFKVDMEVELPLYGTAKNFTIVDTIPDLKLNVSGDDFAIQKLLLRVYISNGFPADIGVQVYFTDSLYNKIDSLISPYQVIIPSASVNGSTGKVTKATTKTTDANFDNARISKLSKVRKALVKGVVSTVNNGTTAVKFYSDYRLDVKIGIQATLNVKISK